MSIKVIVADLKEECGSTAVEMVKGDDELILWLPCWTHLRQKEGLYSCLHR